MENEQLLKKLQMVVSCLVSQIEALGIMIDHKTGELNHGALGLTIGTHNVGYCVMQIDVLLEIRQRFQRELAELNQNYESHINLWADGLLNSMDVT